MHAGTNRYVEALDKLAQRYRDEPLDDDIAEDATLDDTVVSGDLGDSHSPEGWDDTDWGAENDDTADEIAPTVAGNLGHIPAHDWGALPVSEVSVFSDDMWDFRDSDRTSLSYDGKTYCGWDTALADGSTLLSTENHPRLTVLKVLAYYHLPQNSVLRRVRAFNSTIGHITTAKLLARIFVAHDLYLDSQGNGTFRTIQSLDRSQVLAAIADLPSPHARYRVASLIHQWYKLSRNGYIPAPYRLDSELIDKHTFRRLVKEARDATDPWQPIPLDMLSALISDAARWVEGQFGDGDEPNGDILYAYDHMFATLAGEYTGRRGRITTTRRAEMDDALRAVLARPSLFWDEAIFTNESVSFTYRGERNLQHAILHHPDWPRHPEHVPDEKTFFRTIRGPRLRAIATGLRIDPSTYYERRHTFDHGRARRHLSSLLWRLEAACVVIILATTAMRVSELCHLESGCSWKVGDSEFWMRFHVIKTSDYSQGDLVKRPIPEITYKAMRVLDALGKRARVHGHTKHLLLSIHGVGSTVGIPISKDLIRSWMQRYPASLGLDSIHPHQFRKNLAMYVIYQDSRHLGLIKRLLNHKSLRMTMAYIMRIPGIGDDIKQALVEQNRELLAGLLESIDRGTIGGQGGLRVRDALKASTLFPGILHDDGWETLSQYVDMLLDDGVNLLHRTPLCICIKTPGVDQPAPCDAPYAPKIKRIHPNIVRCDPFDCRWAAFTEEDIPQLENERTFHEGMLAHPYCSPRQRRFSERRVAQCNITLAQVRTPDMPYDATGPDARPEEELA